MGLGLAARPPARAGYLVLVEPAEAGRRAAAPLPGQGGAFPGVCRPGRVAVPGPAPVGWSSLAVGAGYLGDDRDAGTGGRGAPVSHSRAAQLDRGLARRRVRRG